MSRLCCVSQGYSRSWRHVVLAVPVCPAMRSMSVSMIEVFLSVGLWLSLDGDPFFAVSLSGFQQESSGSQWLAERSRDELEEVVERSCGRSWGDWPSLTGRLPREWRCEGGRAPYSWPQEEKESLERQMAWLGRPWLCIKSRRSVQ